MSLSDLKRPKAPETDGDSNFIDKEELVDAIIAYDVIDYDPKHDGKFGVAPRIIVDMIVASGPHKGLEQRDTHFFGNLAKQLNEAAEGDGATVAKIISGKGKRGRWYGADVVGDDDFKLAGEVVASVLAANSGNGNAAPF